MKIILSVEPIKFPLTGIGRYTYELAKGLQSHNEIEELNFFSGTRFLSNIPTAKNTSDSSHWLKKIVQSNSLAIETYRLLMPQLKKKALRGYERCLFHGPNYFLPPFDGPAVATFHDLSPFKWEHCFDPKRNRYTKKEMMKALSRANGLITVSNYIRKEIHEYFDYPIEKIHTVHLASSPDFYPRQVEHVSGVLKKFGLSYKTFTLFVGTIEPRKNILSLIHAYRKLPEGLRARYPLVLSGYKGWRNDDIMQEIERGQREGWLKYLGFAAAEELPLLYSAARLFVFPSHYEGFGLPVLEAMSSGTPVICSNSSSLPEIAGDAALTHSPEDVSLLTQLIIRGLTDEAWRKDAIALGLSHAATFSWKNCTSQTLNVYQKLTNND
ncbi:glycosyltransferase family 1 protein [Serratia nevei]|uniref:glycosyltransferase family 4 protein n=1 Tax=Serratia TaxID=613 RepID=UPI001889C917|nr:glycosyltransferase family 1 protein [Serratia marcescens]MBF4652577.1 glycosyltransferase family 4 protein [Serratia marcescens]MBF8217954.1 glycosyltransferase family 4 protein [Serratia ureilytica]MBF8243058.1 glycosyltransferase family 4 protein [Serratia ureilytica]CAI1596489.1 Capsular glucan synthase [Serratia marcescens]